jgi:hypothetical protein
VTAAPRSSQGAGCRGAAPRAVLDFLRDGRGRQNRIARDRRAFCARARRGCAFWNLGISPRVEMVDRRIQTVEIPGQEILTGDKVSIRVNVWAAFQVVDAAQARQSVIGQETLSSTSCFDLSH